MTDAGVRPVDNGTGIDHDPRRAAASGAPYSNRIRQQQAGRTGKHTRQEGTAWYDTKRNTTRRDDSEPNWLDGEPATGVRDCRIGLGGDEHGSTMRNRATRVSV